MIRNRNIIFKEPNSTTTKSLGISAQFNFNSIFKQNYTVKDQIKQNFINLVLTEEGERIYNPDFGVGLRSKLFENNISRNDILFRIQQKVELYIPEITINDLTISQNENTVSINIFYFINTLNITDNININLQ